MSNILDALFDILATILSVVIAPLAKAIGVAGPILNLQIGDWVLRLVVALLIVSDLLNTAKWYRREGLGKGIEYAVFIVFIQAVAIIFFWFYPQWLDLSTNSKISAAGIRWVLLFAGSIGWYAATRKHGRFRGLLTYLAHIALFRLGWQFGEWIGVILISVPLLLALYFSLYHLAMAIVPAANPDAPFLSFDEVKKIAADLWSILKKAFGPEPKLPELTDLFKLLTRFTSAISKMGGEKWRRFLILFWYLWGHQYPQIVVPDTLGRQIETRISGSPFRKLGAPGMIWCKSNQVVGLTDGPNFARVGGPGPVFTEHFERPVQLLDLARSASEAELVGCVDLRTQLRSTPIDAVSKDGHPFQAILFIAFSIDPQEEWPRADYHRLQKANPILKEGRTCDQGTKAYPYNQARVQAALSTTAINDAMPSGSKAIHWDEWVLNQLSEATRLVLSQRNLDEIWRPCADGPGKNALDEIGGEIKTRMAPKLQEFGIQLFTARVVNYNLPEDHPVVKQQIANWNATWDKRAKEILADGQAEANRLELEARAYARYMFLTMVADGLKKAKDVHQDLPKRVVAMRVIAAMEELLRQRPGATSEETVGHLAAIRQRMLPRS